VIIPKGMRWAGHVACNREDNLIQDFWRKKTLKRKFGRLGVYGKIILK
jgi:hypothetical protein